MSAPPVEEILEELSPFPNGLTPDDDVVPRRGPAPRLRWAVVGLGHFAQSAILPAFAHVKNEHLLTALVTHDRKKGDELRAAYGIERVVDDAGLGALLRSGTVDAVYIALPNHLHAPYTIEAARAGVHVLCERPMAVSRQDCQAMIAAAEAHHVQLMIAYRRQVDPANAELLRRIQKGEIGEVRFFSASLSFQLTKGNVRSLDSEDGGGVVYDLGVSCINAARCVFGDEPVSVIARLGRKGDPRFLETEDQVAVILDFPGGGLASFVVSLDAGDTSTYHVAGTRGVLRLESAFGDGAATLVQVGEDGETRQDTFPPSDQVAAEIAYFGECIREGHAPRPSGRDGLHDVIVVEAIRRSLETGLAEPLDLAPVPGPKPDIARVMPPPVPPKVLVGVVGPHR